MEAFLCACRFLITTRRRDAKIALRSCFYTQTLRVLKRFVCATLYGQGVCTLKLIRFDNTLSKFNKSYIYENIT